MYEPAGNVLDAAFASFSMYVWAVGDVNEDEATLTSMFESRSTSIISAALTRSLVGSMTTRFILARA